MKLKLADLWRAGGTIDRGTYAIIGVLGFALKHNLDRFVASYWFHRPWTLFNYWMPVRDIARITELPRRDAAFLATMVALAFPFIWVGVVLTMKRLRSAGLPLPLMILFFVPFLNLAFFLVLCLLPGHTTSTSEPSAARAESLLWRVLPDSALGSAAVSLVITVPLGVGAAVLGAEVLQNYGWGLFVALPFAWDSQQR